MNRSPAFQPVLPPLSNRYSYHLRAPAFTYRKNASRPKFAASARDHNTLLIIPTGIGASIGGYAGDALPVARLLASVTDTLITHPNVLNGALMYWPIPNALYVEGFALDRFCTGNLHLKPMTNKSNKIGLLLDAAMPDAARIRHLQAADAARATLGIQIVTHTVTECPVGVTCSQSSIGASWGTILRPDVLLRAAQKLCDAGCDAIAVVTEFPDEDSDQLAEYRSGNAVDSIAGAEAVISHLITKHFNVPCAHAPSLPPLDVDKSVSPKAAAEELGYTFLSCVLVGLSRAPRLIPSSEFITQDVLRKTDVDAVVAPAYAFGSAALMGVAACDDVLMIGVKSNKTVVDVPPQAVGIAGKRVVMANSYAEAAGMIAANRNGIALGSLTGDILSISYSKV